MSRQRRSWGAAAYAGHVACRDASAWVVPTDAWAATFNGAATSNGALSTHARVAWDAAGPTKSAVVKWLTSAAAPSRTQDQGEQPQSRWPITTFCSLDADAKDEAL